MLYRITNSPNSYSWGGRGGIARLMGQEPTDDVQAELWLGAHQQSPSMLLGDAPWKDLAGWEKSRGESLGFLMKVLDIAAPLSIQAHPNSSQALAGFGREESDGVAFTDRSRNYRDPFAKPELVVAVSAEFSALVGFRSAALIMDDLRQLRCVVGDETLLDDWYDELAIAGVAGGVRWAYEQASHHPDLLGALGDLQFRDPRRSEVLLELGRHFPGDVGVALAFLMNIVDIHQYESIWIPEGTPHAYLRGSAIELMGPSDNVLRGGLTTKHVDPREFMRVAILQERTPQLLTYSERSGVALYSPADRGEAASSLALYRVHSSVQLTLDRESIAVITAGAFVVTDPDGTTQLERGSSVFLATPGMVRIEGTGTMWLATIASG